MQFEKIPFKQIERNISNLFQSEEQNFTLTPSSIALLAQGAGHSLNWRDVPHWDKFEKGEIDFSSEQMFELLFQLKPQSEPLLIITDENFKHQVAYLIKYSNLLHFANEAYPKLNQMEFIQPLDLIFFSPEDNLLTMLHHEGKCTQYQAAPEE